MWLADTSAWVWSRRRAYPELRAWCDDQLVAGEIAICDVVRLELLYGTRAGDEHERRRDELAALVTCPIGAEQWERAIAVQGALARLGPDHVKAAKWQDIVVAAAAESADVAVLHYDKDFDWIVRITGQAMRWLAPAGSLS
ncbi:MAG: PIN domain-containing protein [Actinomycetota bacterium]